MQFPTSALLLSLATSILASPVDNALSSRATCSNAQKMAGMRQELVTIGSHSFADANKIPYAPLCSRTFIILPDELQTFFAVPVPASAGVTAVGVRTALVGLGTALDASVENGPDAGAKYTFNKNGTVTVDFVQVSVIPSQLR